MTTTSLGQAAVGVRFEAQLQAAPDSLDNEWGATTDLPPGLDLSAAGVLSGAPTTPGSYTIGVTVGDGTNDATASFPLTVTDTATTPATLAFGTGDRSDQATADLSVPRGATLATSVTLDTTSGLAFEVCNPDGTIPTARLYTPAGALLGTSTPTGAPGCAGVDPRASTTENWASTLPAGTYKITVSNPQAPITGAGAAALTTSGGGLLPRIKLAITRLIANLAGHPGAKQISSSGTHTCAVLDNGQARCWGWNASGELGNGTTTDSPIPVVVGGAVPLGGVTQITTGRGTQVSCALLSTSQARCWGFNGGGALGDGTTNSSPLPVPVGGATPLSGITALSITPSAGCALLNTGQARCWGTNDRGQLGNVSGAYTNTVQAPLVVGGEDTPLNGITQITTDGLTTCALLNTGQARCWGYNYFGQAGEGSGGWVPTVVTVQGVPLSGITQITTFKATTCAALDTGQARCWGDGTYGKLGNPSQVRSGTPLVVGGDIPVTDVAQITIGDSSTCAVLRTGQARCWGLNDKGQLGYTATGPDSSSAPFVGGTTPLTGVVRLSTDTGLNVGSSSDGWCALLNTGRASCWGRGSAGELGSGASPDFALPGLVGGAEPLTGVTQVSDDGFGMKCAVLDTGQVRCWGSNFFGQLGDGTWATVSPLPVPVLGIGRPLVGPAGGDPATVPNKVVNGCGPVVGGVPTPGTPAQFFGAGSSPPDPNGRATLLRDLVRSEVFKLGTELQLAITDQGIQDLRSEFTHGETNPLAAGLKGGVKGAIDAAAGITPYIGVPYGIATGAFSNYQQAVAQVATNQYYGTVNQYTSNLTTPLFDLSNDDQAAQALAGVYLNTFVQKYGRCPYVQGSGLFGDDNSRFRAIIYRATYPGSAAAVDPTDSNPVGLATNFARKIKSDDIGGFFQLLRRIRKGDGRAIRLGEGVPVYSDGSRGDLRAIVQTGQDAWLYKGDGSPLPIRQFTARDIAATNIPTDTPQSGSAPKKSWVPALGGFTGIGPGLLSPGLWTSDLDDLWYPTTGAAKSVRALGSPTFVLPEQSPNGLGIVSSTSYYDTAGRPYFWVIANGTPLRMPDLNAQLNTPGYRYPMAGN